MAKLDDDGLFGCFIYIILYNKLDVLYHYMTRNIHSIATHEKIFVQNIQRFALIILMRNPSFMKESEKDCKKILNYQKYT